MNHKWMYLALFCSSSIVTLSAHFLARNSTPSSASSPTSRRNKHHETKAIPVSMVTFLALIFWRWWSPLPLSTDRDPHVPSIQFVSPSLSFWEKLFDKLTLSSLLFMLLKNTKKYWQQLIWSTWIIVELYNLLLVAAHTHIHTRYLFLQIWPISIFPSRLLLVSFHRWLIFFPLSFTFPLDSEPFGQLAKLE